MCFELQSWKPPGTAPLPKPSREDRERKNAKRRADLDDLKKSLAKSIKPKREGIGPRLRALVMERDKFCCVLCGSVGSAENPLQIGHIVPVAGGGTNGEENLRVECRDCNLGGGARKRARPVREPAERIPQDRIVSQLAKLVGKPRKEPK